MRKVMGLFLLVIGWVLLSGCSATPKPYVFTPTYDHKTPPSIKEGAPWFERGRPVRFLDATASAGSVPLKIVFLNGQLDHHRIAPETERVLREYMEANGLKDVKVRFNQWAPHRDFVQLVRNKKVHWIWRGTIGVVATTIEAVTLGRLFGTWILGDHYNPWTDTIHMYSDDSMIALHEGGHAKDYATKRWPALYAIVSAVPGVNLWLEYYASRDAVRWVHHQDGEELDRETEGYHTLYPAFGSHVGATVGGRALTLGGIGVGHLGGWIHGSAREKEQRREQRGHEKED
jgi:hypothetical protein